MVEYHGSYRLPDDRARGRPSEPEPVYTVRFAAHELFGEGEHTVTVDVWQTHLSRTDDTSTGDTRLSDTRLGDTRKGPL